MIDREMLALDILESGRFTVRPPQGQFCPLQLTAREGTTEVVFQFLADSKWRWTSTSTYGNVQFVHGPGCDASGWVCSPEVVEMIEATLRELGQPVV